MRRAALIACLVLLVAGCRHTPPVVVPPTPTPTPVVTPTPEPTPDWQEYGRRYLWWGADGIRCDNACQRKVWEDEVLPLCGAHGALCGPMQGDQEARLGSSEDFTRDLLPRMRQYAMALGRANIWVGLDWAGLEWTPEGEVASAPLIRPTLEVYAPYWSRVRAIWLDGEAGLTGAQIDAKARFVQAILRDLGVEYRVMTVDVLEKELNEQRPQDARNPWIVWMLEAYDAGAGSGSRAEDRRLIQEALTRQLALLPAGSRFGIWPAAYDRNGFWAQSKEDLAAVVTHAFEWIMADADRRRRCVIVAPFCWVRAGNCNGGWCGGGARDYPLTAQQLKRGIAWLETGADPGPAVPPASTPTPAATPEPDARGYVTNGAQGCGTSGGGADLGCLLSKDRRNTGSRAGVAMATAVTRPSEVPGCATCWAGEQTCDFTFPAGRDSSQSCRIKLVEGTSLCEVQLCTTAVTGADWSPKESCQHATWSPKGGFGHFRCAYTAPVTVATGSAVFPAEHVGARVVISYHLVDAAGKAEKPNTRSAEHPATDKRNIVPLGVVVKARGPQGSICLDGAVAWYGATMVRLPLKGEPCAPYVGQ